MLLARHPGPILAARVEMLWYCEGYQAKHSRERVLPSGRFQMIIDLAAGAERCPGLIVGMRTAYSVIETAGLKSIMGVVFRPGGARGFFERPAEEFRDSHVPLDEEWGSGVAGLRDRLREASTPVEKLCLLEAELEMRVDARRRLHGAVQLGLVEFARAPHARSVLEVAHEAGLSRRRFAQLFREQVGLTPKLYCQLRRFQKVVHQIATGAPVDWAEVALAGGFCDQAHMANEFRGFSGLSPGAFLASERPFRNHVVVD